ncbi:urease accessory protein UreD [Pseudaestuariivita sp.]|uniref:urease accessory protein UreD n=1 Tax=Pseudaestuariivita sp. TaxID=2211669 RepID=UPI0040597F21
MTAQALPSQPRAIGRLAISAHARGGASRLGRLHQSGALRALFPQTAAELTAVMLNTSGGVTGGDRFDARVTAEAGATLTVTTQAAERIYRAQPTETGQVRSRLEVAAGARLNWVPQETILFDGGRLDRHLSADVAEGGTLLVVEPMVFGRAAMGERLRALDLVDRIDITRAGAPVFADRTRLVGDVQAILQRPGVADGMAAQAAVILISPEAGRLLAPLRQLMPRTGGASVIRSGVLFARVVAEDGFALRKTLVPALTRLGAAVPRTWQL